MNLYDIVELSKVDAEPLSQEETKASNTLYRKTKSILTSLEDILPEDSEMVKTALQLSKSLQDHNEKEQDQIRKEYFLKNLILPSSITNKTLGVYSDRWDTRLNVKETLSVSSLTKMNSSPHVKLEEIRKVSSEAKMIIIPFEYLDKKSYSSEDFRFRRYIESFKQASKEIGLDLYVVAPLRHYSILNHISASNPSQQIIGNDYQQNFDTLNMMLPLLIMFADRITNVEGGLKSLYERVNDLDAEVKGVARGLKAMETQMEKMQAKIEHIQLENIKRNNELEAIKEAQERFESQYRNMSWFMAYEPMMFATKKDEDISSSDGYGIIGPCWGPDFDEIVANSLSWRKIAGQRKLIENLFSNTWD